MKETIFEKKEELRLHSKQDKHDRIDISNTSKLNDKMQKENSIKIRHLRRITAERNQIKEVNNAMRLGIDKLGGVAYGRGKSQ